MLFGGRNIIALASLVAFCGDGRDSAFLLNLERDGIEVGGTTIRVTDGVNEDKDDTGSITWDGAIIISKLFDKNPTLVGGKVVYELGAGTGLCGLAAAAAGSRTVLITDLDCK